MRDLTKIPVTIVTGFLGSGKTTMISHLIGTVQDRRLAVVVNEFGDVGVDGEILKSCSIPNCPAENIVELSNGCICCTVADDFIPTIEALLRLEPQPEHILIETSGLALPKPLLKAFDWPAIRSKITVDGVIALADAEAVAMGQFAPDLDAVEAQRAADDSLDHETPLSEVFEDQINCADLVLLTKSDLVSNETKYQAQQTILDLAPREIPIIPISQGEIDPKVILGLFAAAEDDLEARPSHHDNHHDHEHDDFDTIVVNLPSYPSAHEIAQKVEAMAKDLRILRVKGYVDIAGKPMRLLLQAVGTRVRTQFDRPWAPEESRKTQLVVIAEHDHIDRPKIEAALSV